MDKINPHLKAEAIVDKLTLLCSAATNNFTINTQEFSEIQLKYVAPALTKYEQLNSSDSFEDFFETSHIAESKLISLLKRHDLSYQTHRFNKITMTFIALTFALSFISAAESIMNMQKEIESESFSQNTSILISNFKNSYIKNVNNEPVKSKNINTIVRDEIGTKPLKVEHNH